MDTLMIYVIIAHIAILITSAYLIEKYLEPHMKPTEMIAAQILYSILAVVIAFTSSLILAFINIPYGLVGSFQNAFITPVYEIFIGSYQEALAHITFFSFLFTPATMILTNTKQGKKQDYKIAYSIFIIVFYIIVLSSLGFFFPSV